MFTGIVHGKGKIVECQQGAASMSFWIEMGSLAHDLKQGASVSVSGVCLTAVDFKDTLVQFDVIEETLRKTNLGTRQVGDEVNLERSYRVGDEVGGHVVSGHVSTTAKIISLHRTTENCQLVFEIDPKWMEYILPKGFIALDGCSLTLVDVTPTTFSVHLIPETLQVTTFGQKKEGDLINVEIETQTYVVVETVKRFLERHP